MVDRERCVGEQFLVIQCTECVDWYVSQVSGSRFTRLNVVVGANACVISAGLLLPLSEPTMGFGWVMPCVTCTFGESSWRTGSVSSVTWRQSLTRCLCNYQVCCVNERQLLCSVIAGILGSECGAWTGF